MANGGRVLLYEYYWEYNFPQTPTTFALRGKRYKFIQYHGIWDIDELYDLKNDPARRKESDFRSEPKEADSRDAGRVARSAD